MDDLLDVGAIDAVEHQLHEILGILSAVDTLYEVGKSAIHAWQNPQATVNGLLSGLGYAFDLRNGDDIVRGGVHSGAESVRDVGRAYADGRLTDHLAYNGGRALPDLIFGAVSGGTSVAGRAGAKAIAGELAETAVIRESRSIVTSPQMAALAAAHGAGEPLSVRIGGRLIQYEPGLPASGMTNFGENGFLLGREAFSTNAEHNMTVLHELHRLTFTRSSTVGFSSELAAQETRAAAEFAARHAGELP